MNRLWILYFPLLFLPNLGFSHKTDFGVLEVSDWLILPFVVLLLIAPSAQYDQLVSRLKPLLWSFLVWSLFSTLSIHARYHYLDDLPILVGSCLKLGRLVLYGFAGILVTRRLSSPGARTRWAWSLIASLCLLSIGLLVGARAQTGDSSDTLVGYKSYNAIIVSVAVLCTHVTGLWIDNVFGRKWSRCAFVAILFAVCSVLLSTNDVSRHGRGGWVSLAFGLGYISCRRPKNLKVLAILATLAMALSTAYEVLPSFRSFVEMTISAGGDSTTPKLDDGARLSTWAEETPKFLRAPFLGSGFYHRGGESGLWRTGSHNFFIQMFLETGVVGGISVLLLLALCWRQAGSRAARENKVDVATRAALLAAIAGGMSGEYFYGGVASLVLFAAFALVGSLPSSNRLAARPSYSVFPNWRTAS